MSSRHRGSESLWSDGSNDLVNNNPVAPAEPAGGAMGHVQVILELPRLSQGSIGTLRPVSVSRDVNATTKTDGREPLSLQGGQEKV